MMNSLSTKGDYYLHIPARSMRLGGRVYEKDITINVPFDPTLGIQLASVKDIQEYVKVYNLQGQLVKEGKASEVLNGLKGLYIVNGKKMIIKPSK